MRDVVLMVTAEIELANLSHENVADLLAPLLRALNDRASYEHYAARVAVLFGRWRQRLAAAPASTSRPTLWRTIRHRRLLQSCARLEDAFLSVFNAKMLTQSRSKQAV